MSDRVEKPGEGDTMAGGDDLQETLRQVKRSIRKTVAKTATDPETESVHIADRTNVVIAGNVGSEGTERHVSAVQINRIRQVND